MSAVGADAILAISPLLFNPGETALCVTCAAVTSDAPAANAATPELVSEANRPN